MSLLLLALPSGPPGSYEYATSGDGQTLAGQGSAAAALLPAAGRGVEVVAVAPAERLSWRRLTLPRGVGPGSPRLRAVLAGLLEDQLLDEPEQLHFALDPEAAAGGAVWVAVCDKNWLTAHLTALDAARRPVGRIVPDLYPHTGALRLSVAGTPDRAWALMSGAAVPGGAQALPLTGGAQALPQAVLAAAQDETNAPELLAEPAVAELAEQMLGRRVTIQTSAQRLLAASRSPWDLAQMDLARTGAARAARQAGALWRDFMHAPAWRPARWGIALLLLVQLAGLNVWAWRARQELAGLRAQIDATLTQTFPRVKVVVDAPLQMEREVAALRQSTGAASRRDLEPMLGAWGQDASAAAGPPQGGRSPLGGQRSMQSSEAWGQDFMPESIDFTLGELRVKGVSLNADALATANQRLRPLGYQLQADADGVVLREAAP